MPTWPRTRTKGCDDGGLQRNCFSDSTVALRLCIELLSPRQGVSSAGLHFGCVWLLLFTHSAVTARGHMCCSGWALYQLVNVACSGGTRRVGTAAVALNHLCVVSCPSRAFTVHCARVQGCATLLTGPAGQGRAVWLRCTQLQRPLWRRSSWLHLLLTG